MRRFAFLPLLVGILCLSCQRTKIPTATDVLRPCKTAEGPSDAYCGTLKVFEDRNARTGRQIGLNIVVLPSLSNTSQPDPVFFLAGGPGQGAAQLAKPLQSLFQRINRDRDLVLVDQRGTGKSNPLECKNESDSLREINQAEQASLDQLKACLAKYDANPKLYTTSIAMDDLDDVRRYLGYRSINLYGGSYGTRAALEYLRRHEANVRTVVLDGVAPPSIRLPLFMGRDSERALRKLTADCAQDADCAAKFPDLQGRIDRLLARLDRQPVKTQLAHPRTGKREEVEIRREFVALALFNALYSNLTSSLLPLVLERAESNDFQSLLALVGSNEGMSLAAGMHFSVVCAEDAPKIGPGELDREATGWFLPRRVLESRLKPCEFWPRGEVEDGFYAPPASSKPVLVLSGDLDPVTPPTWGEEVTKTLKNAQHLVVPGTGHGTASRGCVMQVMQDFYSRGSMDGVKSACLSQLKRGPFFTTLAGPDPRQGGAQP
jgi:pimeloyl-ACP methyl ester carboxylesterase